LNNPALPEFKAKEALGLMDQQLSRTDTKPEPVTQ
jgi:hypothetical protein